MYQKSQRKQEVTVKQNLKKKLKTMKKIILIISTILISTIAFSQASMMTNKERKIISVKSEKSYKFEYKIGSLEKEGELLEELTFSKNTGKHILKKTKYSIDSVIFIQNSDFGHQHKNYRYMNNKWQLITIKNCYYKNENNTKSETYNPDGEIIDKVKFEHNELGLLNKLIEQGGIYNYYYQDSLQIKWTYTTTDEELWSFLLKCYNSNNLLQKKYYWGVEFFDYEIIYEYNSFNKIIKETKYTDTTEEIYKTNTKVDISKESWYRARIEPLDGWNKKIIKDYVYHTNGYEITETSYLLNTNTKKWKKEKLLSKSFYDDNGLLTKHIFYNDMEEKKNEIKYEYEFYE